jgi:hypothetical protein
MRSAAGLAALSSISAFAISAAAQSSAPAQKEAEEGCVNIALALTCHSRACRDQLDTNKLPQWIARCNAHPDPAYCGALRLYLTQHGATVPLGLTCRD